jgi:Tol biopolymer transport system component
VPTRRHLALAAVAVLAVLGAVAGGVLIGKRTGARPAVPPPSFERLTFRQGFVHSARFTRDGQSVVYSAAWEGNPLDVYLARLGTPESRPLGLASWNLLAVSPSDELAVSRITKSGGSNLYRSAGTLARLPLTGGSPRDVADDVMYADWSPDGTSLAVVRDLGDRSRLEYPVGKILHESTHYLFNPRISPDGRQVAFWDTFWGQSSLGVVDPSGKVRTLSQGWSDWWYLSWSPDGREIWFGASVLGFAGTVYAVDLDGQRRTLYSGPGAYDVQDVFRDGRALLGSVKQRMRTTSRLTGWKAERELFWFDGTTVVDISKDGTAVLLFELSEAGGQTGSTLLQRNDGSPPVRLGEGRPLGMSPDGRWALAVSARNKLTLLPIGVGEARPVGPGVFEAIDNGAWLPDGKRIAVVANEPGQRMELYLVEVDGGGAEPLGDEGIEFGSTIAVSPDARLVAATAVDGRLVLLPTAGGAPESLPGIQAGDQPITWSQDGRALFVVPRGAAPASIWKVDLRTGRREPWKELPLQDRAGVSSLRAVVLSPESQAYSYTYQQFLTDLYLVQGLK